MAGAGYFVSLCKALNLEFRRATRDGLNLARRKIAGYCHCVAGPPGAASPLRRPRCGPLREGWKALPIWRAAGGPGLTYRSRILSARHEARRIHLSKLDPHGCPKRVEAKPPEVLIQVSAAR